MTQIFGCETVGSPILPVGKLMVPHPQKAAETESVTFKKDG